MEEEELTSEGDFDDFEVAGTGKDTDEGLDDDDDGGSFVISDFRTSHRFISSASVLFTLLFSSCRAVFTSMTVVSLESFKAAISAFSALFSLSIVCFSVLSCVRV